MCVFQENPYVMLQQNHQELEGNDRYEGFCVDMLKELADILKFKYRIRLVDDGLYGVPGANGTWTGMVGELISRVCKRVHMQSLWCSLQTSPRTINYLIYHIVYTCKHTSIQSTSQRDSRTQTQKCITQLSYSSQLAAFLHVVHFFSAVGISA